GLGVDGDNARASHEHILIPDIARRAVRGPNAFALLASTRPLFRHSLRADFTIRIRRRSSDWLPAFEDREYVRSLMKPVTEPDKIANWIAPAKTGVNHRPFEFEYVRL